jgi:hypothetical protein
MTPYHLLRRRKARVLVTMQQHGNEQRTLLPSRKIDQAWPRQQLRKPLRGIEKKRSGIESKTVQFSELIISSWIPFMHRRAASLALTVGGHQLVDVAPIGLERFTLPASASLSRTDSGFDDIQKPALTFVHSKIG